MKNYSEAPYIITVKDLGYLSDIFSWNYNACKLAESFEQKQLIQKLKIF